MTLQEASYYILNQLGKVYEKGETSKIADLLLEKITGSSKTERMLYKTAILTTEEEKQLKEFTDRVSKQEPIQYILQESWFCGLKFYVDNNVLIPRPETEELVEWIISNMKFPLQELQILDIGTGSGCIAMALKKRLRKASIWACDVSETALNIAKKNSETLNLPIEFRKLDFADQHTWNELSHFDIIVSNPPYVPEADKQTMNKNVLEYEPAIALFVPDNDPLFFYKKIAAFAKSHLRSDGAVYCEIHEDLGNETKTLFSSESYQTELRKDMQGKNRMIKAWAP